ncbi:hypothetical protein [Burkholderia gladioli]|jgi:hypothetical protein|uniref:hypothetical protein n=1 Tax=Burkholderia gladioli TaxID=28095 RepID=UPI001364941C|nr:hypothetical protein [Burkholderia gladioli]KAF1063064.1 hypothetical protein LvStA_01701 [Burkholderia gladioli]MDN7600687.1 hypothetical protein [Burkholderia gladioli]
MERRNSTLDCLINSEIGAGARKCRKLVEVSEVGWARCDDSRPYELKATEKNPAFKSDWDDYDMQASLERMQGGQA